MAIRNSKLGGFDWGSESPSFQDMNDTNDALIKINVSAVSSGIKNNIRQLQDRAIDFSGDGDDVWAEAYVNSSGRMNSVASYTTIFSTDNHSTINQSKPGVLIEATSIPNESAFNINNCILNKIESNKWVLISTSVDEEVQRSEIYKTLYYGTDGSNYRVSNTYITNLVSLKTNIVRDDNKKAFLIELTGSRAQQASASTSSRTLDITFDDTTNNGAASIWTNWSVGANYGTSYPTDKLEIEFPNGSFYINESIAGRSYSDSASFIGTDEKDFEVGNPVDARFKIDVSGGNDNSNGVSISSDTLLLSASAFQSQITEQNGSNTSANVNVIDLVSEINTSYLIYEDFNVNSLILHNLPSIFQKPATKSVGTVLYDDWEEGNSVEYKFVDSNDNETAWLSEGEFNSFSEITPEKVVVKLNRKETSPTTGFPSIKGFGFKAWNN